LAVVWNWQKKGKLGLYCPDLPAKRENQPDGMGEEIVAKEGKSKRRPGPDRIRKRRKNGGIFSPLKVVRENILFPAQKH